jgi:hypothetical protein
MQPSGKDNGGSGAAIGSECGTERRHADKQKGPQYERAMKGVHDDHG